MTQVDIADENLLKLTQIQDVVMVEDGLESSIDEVLARVLGFYRKFVPYDLTPVPPSFFSLYSLYLPLT